MILKNLPQNFDDGDGDKLSRSLVTTGYGNFFFQKQGKKFKFCFISNSYNIFDLGSDLVRVQVL